MDRAVKHGMAIAAWALCAATHATCPPANETTNSLQALKAAKWQLAGDGADARRQALALALVDCLAEPDPLLRDGLAFEALSAWMRGKQLELPTLQSLRTRLLAMLAAPADTAGFAQPFAALALSEVARVDRLQPFLSDAELEALVNQAAHHLAGVRDLRGFDAREGWRHGVAHGADLMLQLALNPRLQSRHADTMLTAIAAQVMPAGEHAYRYGEPARLVRPVFFLARRAWWGAPQWEAWLDALVQRRVPPQPVTQASLAQRHNLGAFVSALYVAVQESPDAELKSRLLPGLRKAIGALD